MTPHALATLIDLAQTQADQAGRRLGELQRAQLSAQEQLALLEGYRCDYLARLNDKMAQGLSVEQLRNYQGFILTLDEAIALQARLAEQAQGQLAQGRQDWQHSQRKLGAFDTLSERLKRHALQVRGKKEQRDSDERAARPRSALGSAA